MACPGGDNGYTRLSGTSVVKSLQPNTTYYWQVRAYNNAGFTPANGVSGWWSFTTAPATALKWAYRPSWIGRSRTSPS